MSQSSTVSYATYDAHRFEDWNQYCIETGTYPADISVEEMFFRWPEPEPSYDDPCWFRRYPKERPEVREARLYEKVSQAQRQHVPKDPSGSGKQSFGRLMRSVAFALMKCCIPHRGL